MEVYYNISIYYKNLYRFRTCHNINGNQIDTIDVMLNGQ